MPRRNKQNDDSFLTSTNIVRFFTVAAAIFFIISAIIALQRGAQSLEIQKSIESSTLRTELQIIKGVNSTINTEIQITILVDIIIDFLNITLF